MNIDKYKKLREDIEVNTFEKSYIFINKVLFGFTILAHLASIVFGYIFVFNLLYNSTDPFWGKIIIVPLITIISLASFELLKRFLFRQTSLNYLIKRSFTKEVTGTALLSLLLITLTFYLSLNGAENMGDRSKVIENVTESKINIKADSIANLYDKKITKVDFDKTNYFNLSTTTRSRALKEQYNGLIETADKYIKQLEIDKEAKIKEYQSTENSKADVKRVEVGKNILSFLIICTFIETIILIGVWFNTYYEFRSFKDFNDRVSNQQNYKRYLMHEILLDIVYNKGKVQIGDILDSSKSIKRLTGIRGVNITEKQIKDFFTLTKHLKITTTEANRRFVEKGYDDAKELILEYYNVD
jgi:hypothetical protein